MSESFVPGLVDLAALCRQHIDSLRAGGVEWIAASSRKTRKAPAASTSLSARAGSSPAVGRGGGTAGDAAPVLPATGKPNREERRRELELVAKRVSVCPRCAELAATRTQTVFGVGPLDAVICFVGEAPGADEDAQGEPFVGAAGQLLNKILAACKLKREEVYICNILKCRPPGNRLPLPNEAANCREYLDRQIELVRPRSICALGACAAQNLLHTTTAIGRLRGRFHEYRGIPVLCTYHPAYLLRSPDKKKDVWQDMKLLMRHIGRPVG